MVEQDIYIANGYKSRRHYLSTLAEDYGIDEEVVLTLASLMGPNEDFDGLVSEIQSYAEMVNS